MKPFLNTLITTFIAASLLLGSNSYSQSLPAATGRILLTVSGAIQHSNAERDGQPIAQFDRALLEQSGIQTLATRSEWTDGVQTFSGPLARAILDTTGAAGTTLVAVALNDYQVNIPLSDVYDYPVILATTVEGKLLTRRDKGPLWIIYPRDDYPELANPETNTKWVWQLKELIVK